MLASRAMVSIRFDLPEPLIPIRTFSGRSFSGSVDSPKDRRLHTEICSIGMGIRTRTLLLGGGERNVTGSTSAGPAYQIRAVGDAGADRKRLCRAVGWAGRPAYLLPEGMA